MRSNGTRPVRKAVLPVAGLGTRFLPATKAVPKELLPIVDRPLIQCATDEAVEAGIVELVFVTSRSKPAIADHYDSAHELERELESKGKTAELETLRGILPANVHCVFVNQERALGLGHAVLCARHAVGDEPFAVILPDDLIVSSGAGCLAQMVALHDREGDNFIAVQDVARQETDCYGIVAGTARPDGNMLVERIVEKPAPAEAPSTLGVVGRYVLDGAIFDLLERTEPGAGGEIQLTDAIAALTESQDVIAYRFDGTRYDCGSKSGFLRATVDMALADPETGADFRAYLQRVSTTGSS